MRDHNDYDAHEISVKLRGPTGGKINRNPHHLEQAVKSLVQEVLDLNGPKSLYRIVGDIAAVYAADAGLPNSVLTRAVECVINMPLSEQVSAVLRADNIVYELRDMNLLD